MAINKKFLTSVADVYAYDTSDNILFTGKTLLDSSIEVSLGSAPVRGGRGQLDTAVHRSHGWSAGDRQPGQPGLIAELRWAGVGLHGHVGADGRGGGEQAYRLPRHAQPHDPGRAG